MALVKKIAMEIKTIKDIKSISGIMHDAEFSGGDFSFEPVTRKFFFNARAVTMQGRFFQTRAPIQSGKRFHLELCNVEEYTPVNLDKILAGKAFGGVLNYIKIRNNGRNLTIVSQDLRIELKLSKLEGLFEEIE